MQFPPSFLDELRLRLSPSAVIGKVVKLTAKGRGEFMGLCPFHREKTPSFTVSDDKGFFHCFGCGVHGDIVGFVMQHDRLEFPDAVKQLAGEAGLALPAPETQVQKEQRERNDIIREAMEFATFWFEQQLRQPVGMEAKAYLERRGLNAETIAEFRLGYAPDTRSALKEYLSARGISLTIMQEAGLIIQPENGGEPYDRFRGRAMFPITDAKGQVIAFGGRAMQPDQQPKYLNSPETPIFKKGRLLYNYARARVAAKETGRFIVVEGYMDVIAFHRAGIKSAVAPMGTALTPEQLQLLWPLVPEPTLCMDGDSAGIRAMKRAAELAMPLLKPGHSLGFALLPAGQDPDDVLNSGGAGALQKIIEAPIPLSEMLWKFETENATLTTPEQRAALETRVMQLVQGIEDKTVREHYRQFMNDQLWEMKRRPMRAAKGEGRNAPPTPRVVIPAANAIPPVIRLEQELLLTLLASPQLLLTGEVEEGFASLEWQHPEDAKLAEAIRNTLESQDFFALSAEEQRIAAEKLQATLEAEGWQASLKRLGKQRFLDKTRDSIADNRALAVWRYLFAARSAEIIKGEYETAVREWWESEPEKVEAFRKQKEEMEATVQQCRASLERVLEH
jgi:DNA primase